MVAASTALIISGIVLHFAHLNGRVVGEAVACVQTVYGCLKRSQLWSAVTNSVIGCLWIVRLYFGVISLVGVQVFFLVQLRFRETKTERHIFWLTIGNVVVSGSLILLASLFIGGLPLMAVGWAVGGFLGFCSAIFERVVGWRFIWGIVVAYGLVALCLELGVFHRPLGVSLWCGGIGLGLEMLVFMVRRDVVERHGTRLVAIEDLLI